MRESEYDHIEREIAKLKATLQPPLARVNPIFTRKPYSCSNYSGGENDLRTMQGNDKSMPELQKSEMRVRHEDDGGAEGGETTVLSGAPCGTAEIPERVRQDS